MRFLLGVIVGLLIIPIGVYSYFALGLAPVATSAKVMPFESTLARIGLRTRLQKEMPKGPPPIQNTEANLSAGAHTYRQYCADCHGYAGQPLSPVAQDMFPKPPHLLNGTGVSDDPAGETWWKVKNGIRLTGMPAFKDALSDQEIWQVSILLANSDKLPPNVAAELKK